jgi:predicted kinase
MVGLQGSGKSTWVARHLAGTHVVVSKDHWPNARRREARQRRVVDELLSQGRDVVVDNTNPAPADRAALVAAARRHGATVRAVHVDVPVPVCMERNARREGRARVPVVGVLATARRLVPPSTTEGFDRVDVVRPVAYRTGPREPDRTPPRGDRSTAPAEATVTGRFDPPAPRTTMSNGTPDTPDVSETRLARMTIDELREHARTLGIEGADDLHKPELLARVKDHHYAQAHGGRRRL